jgi:hypothetical protein
MILRNMKKIKKRSRKSSELRLFLASIICFLCGCETKIIEQDYRIESPSIIFFQVSDENLSDLDQIELMSDFDYYKGLALQKYKRGSFELIETNVSRINFSNKDVDFGSFIYDSSQGISCIIIFDGRANPIFYYGVYSLGDIDQMIVENFSR